MSIVDRSRLGAPPDPAPLPPLGALLHDWNAEAAGRSSTPIALHDETLREGSQRVSALRPSVADRVALLAGAASLGVRSAAIGFPGSGTVAFDDALAIARAAAGDAIPMALSCAARTLPSDVEAVAAVAAAAGCPIGVAAFIGASGIRRHVEGWTVDHVLRLIGHALKTAEREGLPVMFVLEDATRTAPDVLLRLVRAAVDNGARRLCIADTVGTATPDGAARLVRWLVRELQGAYGDAAPPLDWHGHRDRGLALATALAAADAGAARLHGTALGIGERAGNVELELLLVNLALRGQPAGDLISLPEYAALAARAYGVPVATDHPVLGADAFRTATGVHAAALRKAHAAGGAWLTDRVYGAVPAALVGRAQSVSLTAASGRATAAWWIESHGLATGASAEQLQAMTEALLAAAKRASSALSHDDGVQVCSAMRGASGSPSLRRDAREHSTTRASRA